MVPLLESLLAPTSLCLLLLLVAVLWHKRPRLCKFSLWFAIAILLLCGNEWFVRWAVLSLESQYLPPDPVPQADCIIVLGGGIAPKEPPRPWIELADAGDRVLYAVYLYRNEKAPLILCAGGKKPGSTRETSESEDQRELLQFLNVPQEAIIEEGTSSSTYQNLKNSYALLQEQGVEKVLLVTSALHMPRAMGVARRQMPETQVIPAPTDFIVTEEKPKPLLERVRRFIPTGGRLMQFEAVVHEYLGLAYYRLRGWI